MTILKPSKVYILSTCGCEYDFIPIFYIMSSIVITHVGVPHAILQFINSNRI